MELYGPFKTELQEDPVAEQIALMADEPSLVWSLSYVKYIVSIMPREDSAAICFRRMGFQHVRSVDFI